MSTDKLQALHEALADVFSESPLISTHTEPSPPVFHHEALSEIFSEPPPISINTQPSPPIFHQEALAEILGQPLPISTNTKPSHPIFDHTAFAEILSQPPPISTNTKPSHPIFDQKALAEILSELHPVPINPQPSPLSFDTGFSSAPLSDQLDNGEPVAKTVAVAPSTIAESARPQRAKSLLAKLHYILSTKAEPPPSTVEKDPSPPSLSGQLHKLEPVAKAIAAASSTDAESARPQQATSLLTELSPLISRNSELPSLSLEQKPPSPRLSGQPGNVRPAVSDVAATSPTDTASVRPPRATSLLAETSSLISTNTESSPPIFEKKSSPPTVAGRLDNVEPAVKTVAVASSTDAESARTQQARSLLVEPVPPTSTNIAPSPPIFGKEPSRPILCGQLDNVEPAEKPDVESAQPQQANSSLTELPPLISTNTKSPPPIFETMPSQPILSGQLDNLEPAANVAPTDAESAENRQAKSFLTELPPLISINTETSSPIREKQPSTLSCQPDNARPSAKTVVVAYPTDAESALPQQANSLLAALDLNTAIRLRWVMRDIRSKRTKLSAVSDDDLTALMDLGLVEMREELPRLTALGVLALD
ncbi:hypothetical protein [Bradyrhizobium sp. 200]|uniref:hypothetical protein n=1 Tax=Bradyrhizobium sp. 200 TaxID=2782665 RepID=UPI0020002ADD|nr:hypothetical protein [Bradyrhizobium sp. 200]